MSRASYGIGGLYSFITHMSGPESFELRFYLPVCYRVTPPPCLLQPRTPLWDSGLENPQRKNLSFGTNWISNTIGQRDKEKNYQRSTNPPWAKAIDVRKGRKMLSWRDESDEERLLAGEPGRDPRQVIFTELSQKYRSTGNRRNQK